MDTFLYKSFLRIYTRIASARQFLWVPTTYVFMKKYKKLSQNYHQIPSLSLSLFYCIRNKHRILISIQLQAAVDSMFETICPRQLTSGVLSFQDFEDIIPAYGDLVNDIEAYCGRKSLMNPKRIYPWTADMDAYSLRMVSKALYVSCFCL